MTSFDQVLPELIRLCSEDAPSADVARRYCVVRDVRGRVRLVVETQDAGPLRSLEATLVAALGGYFVGPILASSDAVRERQPLARKVLRESQGKWPTGWPRSVRNVIGAGDTPIDAEVRWTGIERTIGKEAWLTDDPPKPPWPLLPGTTPPIVTFHSFKGGVGRTTMVGAYALRLAEEGKRVAVVDLDLEAPGIGSLLGASTDRGVLDVLVDHLATGRMDLAGASTQADFPGTAGRNVTVFSAGKVNDAYVQKLARLDFSSAEPGLDNPVGVALRAMLGALKNDFDVILLDARAGLHDLAGMSLHGLAHVDVLVFRGTAQNLAGLEQTLRTLGSRTITELVLVETLLPANDDEVLARRRSTTRSTVYEMLCKHVYEEGDDLPQLTDVGTPHDVLSVRRKDWLDSLDSLNERALEIRNDAELLAIAQRIDEQCGINASPEGADENEDSP